MVDIEKVFKKEWEKGKITIQKGTNIILFNSWIGSGSLNEITLKKPTCKKVYKNSDFLAPLV